MIIEFGNMLLSSLVSKFIAQFIPIKSLVGFREVNWKLYISKNEIGLSYKCRNLHLTNKQVKELLSDHEAFKEYMAFQTEIYKDDPVCKIKRCGN